jgi:protein-disulfide isomerase
MSKPTKAQRRDDARTQAQRLREEQQKAARRQRTIAISLLVVGLLVLGGVVAWILSNQPEPPPDFAEIEDPLGSVSAPATANDEGGIPVGQEGVAGDATAGDGAVEVVVYSDYMCPICGMFEEINGPTLDELRENGEIVVEYRPVSILDRTSQGSQFSTRAATAAGLVADQAPEQFVAFNTAMFANQPEEGTEGLSDEQIADLAREAGVDEAVAAQIADGSYLEGDASFSPWVAAATEEATRAFPEGFGTPTILVDGENLSDLEVDWRIEGALAGAIEAARG